MAQTAKQITYRWQGLDARGRPSRGEIGGNSLALVKAQLRKQGIKPTKVRKKHTAFLASGSKIKAMDIAVFTRQLATMMQAGIPLVQSFDIVGESLGNPGMGELVRTIRNDVAAGNNFADTIRKHPRYFDELYCNLIEVGEQSGTLETMLDRLATHQEKSEALKSKLRKGMSYPLTIIAVAMIVTGILLVKVVPQFAETFSSFGAELPLVTQYVIQLSDFAIRWWLWLLAGIVITGLLFRQARARSRAFAEALQRFTLKLPVFGRIVQQSALTRFSRTLSTTFSAGVPLVDALDSVAGAAGNVVYREATCRIRDDVTSGQQLAASIHACGLFPVRVTQMVSTGEESGTLGDMLDKYANYYETEMDNAIDSLTAMMEPMIMAILGVLVGGLMVAMYMPVFRLGSVV